MLFFALCHNVTTFKFFLRFYFLLLVLLKKLITFLTTFLIRLKLHDTEAISRVLAVWDCKTIYSYCTYTTLS